LLKLQQNRKRNVTERVKLINGSFHIPEAATSQHPQSSERGAIPNQAKPILVDLSKKTNIRGKMKKKSPTMLHVRLTVLPIPIMLTVLMCFLNAYDH
jgi:hypothetical protein